MVRLVAFGLELALQLHSGGLASIASAKLSYVLFSAFYILFFSFFYASSSSNCGTMYVGMHKIAYLPKEPPPQKITLCVMECCKGKGYSRTKWYAYRILTVSKGCVAVTAPQAAMPPAMKALQVA